MIFTIKMLSHEARCKAGFFIPEFWKSIMHKTAALLTNISTEQFAELIHGKPCTIRTRLCKTGSYYGIKPIKLPSGRLLWPADAVQALINGKEA